MATSTATSDTAAGTQPFNIDMDLPTTLPQGRGGFTPASELGTPVQVRRSTFLIRMPLVSSRGILMKRLATIILPRHKNIAFLPHTSSTHDKLTDHELVPTDDQGIAHYIFDERTSVRNRGGKNEYKVIECKVQVESPISLYQIKGAKEVMDLLQKHDIYITAKNYCQAVNTKAIGLLMNLDAKRSAKNRIIELFKETVDKEGEHDVFIDLVPHRGLVRLGKKVIFGQFLKVMVDVKFATMAARVIQNGLKSAAFGIGMHNVRLMPVYPIPNLMNAEMFGKMILAHNDSMYGIAEIQVDNIWEIDTKSILPQIIKKRFNLPHGEDNEADEYTLRETIMPIFWGHYNNKPVVRDVYIMRGRLMVVCEKEKVAETTKLVDMLFDFLRTEFTVPHATLTKSADKFAAWVGCSTPKNVNRHPARSGTLVFGEGGLLKATVNSFLDSHLDNLPAGLIPKAGEEAKKPDLSRPPPISLMPRGRTFPQVDPSEFTSTAVNAWASARTWGRVAKTQKGQGRKGKQGQSPHVPPGEVIEIDDATNSTVSMTSSTQAAMEAMRASIRTLEADRKTNTTRIATMDDSIAQIARDVTALSNSQRETNAEYVHIKEQMLSIAKDNGDIRKEMIEMKDMIMCIATHLGGVVRPPPQSQQSQDQLATQPTSQHSANTPSQSQCTQETFDGMQSSETPMTDSATHGNSNNEATRRKKLKQTHLPVFDTQLPMGDSLNRANPPNLMQNASDTSNGSIGNHSPEEVDHASMYD
jgi:hypothetical protein